MASLWLHHGKCLGNTWVWGYSKNKSDKEISYNSFLLFLRQQSSINKTLIFQKSSTFSQRKKRIKNTLNINSQNFQLTLHIERFDNDAQGLLHVNVTSDAVSAKADMDVSINDYEKFLENIQQMHQNLCGEAIIEEPYGDKQFLKFTMDNHTGHVYVKGELASRYNGHIQYLSIENEFDQSSLYGI